VWLGGYLASVTGGSAAKGGDFLLANPQRCSINGRKPTDFRPINGNHRMTLWRGSASGDLPFGVKASPRGTATIQRDVTAAYLEGGRYCAKVTVTVGALSGATTDGLLLRVPLQHSRPSRIVAYVSGWARSMSAAGGPKIGIIHYHWNGSAWASAASRIRVVDIDVNGHFFGIVHLAPSGIAGITSLGYVDVYVGLGVVGATGTLYVNEIGVLNADGEIWTASSEYPDFAQIKAISGHSSDYCYNGGFASGDGWTLGSGWSIASGKATHSTAGAPTGVLSQDLGIVAQNAKATVGVTVSGRTAGSVDVTLAGVTVATMNANATTQSNAYTATAGTLLEFVPTGDFDGSIDDVGVYVAKGDGDAFSGDAWAKAGVAIGGDQGILTTSATLSLLPNRIEWGTEAPTGGDWKVGDVVFNIAPATGTSAFWQCSASGAPGTWKNGPQTL